MALSQELELELEEPEEPPIGRLKRETHRPSAPKEGANCVLAFGSCGITPGPVESPPRTYHTSVPLQVAGGRRG